jgi:hypothetical protein
MDMRKYFDSLFALARLGIDPHAYLLIRRQRCNRLRHTLGQPLLHLYTITTMLCKCNDESSASLQFDMLVYNT